jgi:membrane associated rhomboid family serine protease
VSALDLLLVLGLLAWVSRHPGVRPWLGWVLRALRTGLALLFSSLTLPLGPEDRSVRRQPWVTWTIVGLCVGVFQAQLLLEPGPEAGRRLSQAWTEAVGYAVERPYLDVPPALEAFAGREIAGGRSAQTAPPERPDRATMAREQNELDEKAERVFALHRQWPERRWAHVPARGSVLTEVRATFVHFGWAHLLGNMLFLLAFAPWLEDVYGRALFACLYLGSGVAGAALGGAAHPTGYVFAAGASGAISGVMGAFLVRFAGRRLRLLAVPTPWLPLVRVDARLPAGVFLLHSFALDVRGAVHGIGNTGWWAHIGGFLFGLALAVLLRVARVEERVIDPRIEARVTLRAHPAVERSFTLRCNGKPDAALRVAEAALGERPEDLGLLREAFDAAVAARALDRAATHATRLVARLGAARGPEDLRETRQLVEDVRGLLGASAPARFCFAAGDSLERQGQTVPALLLYEHLAERPEAAVARRAASRRDRLLAGRGAAHAARPCGAAG